ncbi:M23 family metallopeptidase [Niabella drilacis]|uniref:Peptidase family M23 n=1 Tax=Niabella drilacis (strain DSM 25811 / CCM 8410 / CCUG 62505 / LMG 26954 / E90) TaxID=1285928 RepID=A0A1G6PUL5_NIADE|nr:M23 family metallopeptidase [Niabella drilacis]SDC83055.1 Peptidase family M23 [Niabella drilacis]
MRLIVLISLATAVLSGSCAYMNNPLRRETHRLQRGSIIDTSSFIYDLPYPKGVSHTLVQGYFTQFTHKRRAALDFKMPAGSVVCAARDGIVVRLKKDGSQGGIKKSNRVHANYVVIQHADSSRAGYWHLQKDGVLVQVGDAVKKGQPIARSGNTGYTYFPHLHFIVWTFDRNSRFKQMPTRFRTKKGARYLRAIRNYRNPP